MIRSEIVCCLNALGIVENEQRYYTLFSFFIAGLANGYPLDLREYVKKNTNVSNNRMRRMIKIEKIRNIRSIRLIRIQDFSKANARP